MHKRPRYSLSHYPIKTPSKLYLPASPTIVPPFQVIFNRETVNTSYSESTDVEAKRKGRIVNTFDLTNIDDFFSHPSADELAATSERRVEEIMTDLGRLTMKELESWSHGSYTVESFKIGSHESPVYAPDTDMVSLPSSLSSNLSSILAADTNLPAALAFNSKIGTGTEHLLSIDHRAATPSLQSKLLRATTRTSEPNGPVIETHSHTEQTEMSPILSIDKFGIEFLSPEAIDTRITTLQYPNLTLGTPKDSSLPYQKPLPPTPGALLRAMKQAEQHSHARTISETDLDNTQTTRDSQAHFPTVPSIVITSPLQERLTPIHAPAKRKALPLDSPLLAQIEQHPA